MHKIRIESLYVYISHHRERVFDGRLWDMLFESVRFYLLLEEHLDEASNLKSILAVLFLPKRYENL